MERGGSGTSVSLAGDFNGDNVSDVIIGVSLTVASNSVVYGKKGGYPGPIDLASLNANEGVIIKGGWESVSLAGDFNGDGLSDVILGASYQSPPGRPGAGTSYILYGKKGGYSTPIDLAYLNIYQGVIIEGKENDVFLGKMFVETAGDFNDDGLSDVINMNDGGVYIIYGNYSLTPPTDAPTNTPFNPAPVIGASVAAVIGTISVGLAVIYRDKIKTCISSRDYTPI